MKLKRFDEFINENTNVLLAPNGKPSNLNEFQWNQVRTPEFIEWFGDWINKPYYSYSSVLDENGEPMLCYHSSNNKFDKFDTETVNSTNHGKGFYFYDNTGKEGIGKLFNYETYLSIKNPYIITKKGPFLSIVLGKLKYKNDGVLSWSEQNTEFEIKATDKIKMMGYDGIYRPNEHMYIVFSPTQIKSATNNSGEFDKNNPNINETKKI